MDGKEVVSEELDPTKDFWKPVKDSRPLRSCELRDLVMFERTAGAALEERRCSCIIHSTKKEWREFIMQVGAARWHVTCWLISQPGLWPQRTDKTRVPGVQ
jgi:hypothetical protein